MRASKDEAKKANNKQMEKFNDDQLREMKSQLAAEVKMLSEANEDNCRRLMVDLLEFKDPG